MTTYGAGQWDTCWECGDYWPCVTYTDSLGIAEWRDRAHIAEARAERWENLYWALLDNGGNP